MDSDVTRSSGAAPLTYTPADTHLVQRVSSAGDSAWTVRAGRPHRMSYNDLSIDADTKREFYSLVEKWRNDTMHMSLANERASHFAYHQIMGMGRDALPLIFRELPDTTSDWFWALRAIARDKAPVIPDEDKGRVRRITEIWLDWGKANGYV